MNTSELLGELANSEALAENEHRDHARVKYQVEAKVTEIDMHGRPQGTWLCKTSDLSRSGIGLISRRLVHIGRHMLLELETATGTRVLYGVVRHCAYCEGLGHTIGIEFTKPEDNPTLKHWLNTRQT